jgi:endonuclease III
LQLKAIIKGQVTMPAKKGGTKDDRAVRGAEINRRLARAYPAARCSLDFRSPFELLAATILSAQCTDERVNMVTPQLFRRFPGPAELAKASLGEIEEVVKSTGFFRNKAKSLKGMAQALVERHGGRVPGTMEQLVLLLGVGRKTANVLLGNCFGVPGITVDTHMSRVTQRLGLTRNTDPVKIERDLMEVVPHAAWTDFSHRVISHGRAVCDARKPVCDACVLSALCGYFRRFQGKEAKVVGRTAPAARKKRG